MLPAILTEVYDAKTNNCGHFVVTVWEILTGEDITPFILQPLLKAAQEFTKLKKPESPCLVVMTFGKATHVGVWYNDKILHMTEQGPRYQSIESLKENYKYRFYK